MSKFIGVVKITDPTEVANKLSEIENPYINGTIWVTCPELGYDGTSILPCRYALSVPYYQIKVGDRVWIEPTFPDNERWVYTGFVDCGSEDVDPTITNTQGIFSFEDGIVTIQVGADFSIWIDSVAGAIRIETANHTIEMDDATNKVSINGTALEVTG